MRIALVMERFDVHRGGAERSACELACALTNQGHDVTMLAGHVAMASTKTLPFALMRVPGRARSRTGWWRQFQNALGDQLAKGSFDVVHSLVPTLLADVYQPRGGSQVFGAQRHACSYPPAWRRWKQWTAGLNGPRRARAAAERQLCQTPAGPIVAAVSAYVASQYQDLYGLSQDRLRVIRNGVNVTVIRNETAIEQGRTLREMMQRHGGCTTFLFVAENLRLKGLRPLLAAARRARQRHPQQIQGPTHRPESGTPPFRILVVSGEDFSPYYRQAKQLGVEDCVAFMGSTRSMPALLCAVDAVVLPTYNDACSRVVLEALAAARPVITTRYNGAAEFLGESRYGLVVDEPDDTEALAEALLGLCEPKTRQAMSVAIVADGVYEQVSMDRHARELVGLFETLG